jgi:hypothetical protein
VKRWIEEENTHQKKPPWIWFDYISIVPISK